MIRRNERAGFLSCVEWSADRECSLFHGTIMGLRFARTAKPGQVCEKPRGRRSERKKTKACASVLVLALTLTLAGSLRERRIAVQRVRKTHKQPDCNNGCVLYKYDIGSRGTQTWPRDPFKRTRNITNTPNGATPTGGTLRARVLHQLPGLTYKPIANTCWNTIFLFFRHFFHPLPTVPLFSFFFFFVLVLLNCY